MDNDYVAKYYDETLPYYKYTWSGSAHALHYGFWDKNTKNVKEALLNENKFLTEIAKIRATDKILDAGCGVGGSTIWIAENVGANVVGITLSPKQLEKAQKLASKHNVNLKTEFKIDDFLKTSFSDNIFDIVWAIESVCHTENKIDFLAEAYRILKPGGRVIVADGFLMRDVLTIEEKLYEDFLAGLALPNL